MVGGTGKEDGGGTHTRGFAFVLSLLGWYRLDIGYGRSRSIDGFPNPNGRIPPPGTLLP